MQLQASSCARHAVITCYLPGPYRKSYGAALTVTPRSYPQETSLSTTGAKYFIKLSVSKCSIVLVPPNPGTLVSTPGAFFTVLVSSSYSSLRFCWRWKEKRAFISQLRSGCVGFPLTKPRVNLVLIIIRINLAKFMLLVPDVLQITGQPNS